MDYTDRVRKKEDGKWKYGVAVGFHGIDFVEVLWDNGERETVRESELKLVKRSNDDS